MTFGYAPTDKEFDELGLPRPSRFDPYYVSTSRQGLDLINNERVIEFHQLDELGLVAARHPVFDYIRGEIDLKKGFRTAITKNAMMFDRSVDPKKHVVKEHAVGGLGGFVDVLADGEPYEIKTTKADGIDIYQLFAYMDMGNFDTGIFLAPEYATGAEEPSNFIEANHSKKIVLAKLEEFPIIHPLQANEL